MMRKIFACIVFVFILVSQASADISLRTCHSSITDIDGGHSDLSAARFYAFWTTLADDSNTPSRSIFGLSGQMTITGAEYSLWNGSTKLNISPANSHTFTLKADSADSGGRYTEYRPIGNNDTQAAFLDSADGGMNGATVRWSFPDAPLNFSRARIPDCLTTREQLEAFVPYIECVSSGDTVTGLSWRIVSPDDTSSSLPLQENIMLKVSAYGMDNTNFYSSAWFGIDSGDEPEGTVSFAEPVTSSDLRLIVVNYCKGRDDSQIYQWRYIRKSEAKPEIRITHMSEAKLDNGRADFSSAVSLGVALELYGEDIFAESKYFTDDGSITIEGTEGSLDITHTLQPVSGLSLGSGYISYKPVDDWGNIVNFSEDVVSGKNAAWIIHTVPGEPDIEGSTVIPAFRSTERQLSEGVPYIELVKDGSNVTGIIFRLASAHNTSVQVSPGHRVDLYFRTYNPSGKNYNSGWQNNIASGSWDFDSPVFDDSLKGVYVKVRTWDASGIPCVYQWNFAYDHSVLDDMEEEIDEFGEAVLEGGEEMIESISDLGDAIGELAEEVADTAETALVIALIALVLGIIVFGVAGKGCDSGMGLIGLAVLILFILIRRRRSQNA